MHEHDVQAALPILSSFLATDLGHRIRALEDALVDETHQGASAAINHAGFDSSLLSAGLAVRERLGKLNDVIHAAAIAVALPELLEDGETIVKRPSLGAGNDPSRKFDLETDRRTAEFKLSRWRGADGARQRAVFKDLATLLLDGDARRKQLFVLGSRPVRWLSSTSTPVRWALDGLSDSLRARFTSRFDSTEERICDFVASHGREVEIIDLETWRPKLFAPSASKAPEATLSTPTSRSPLPSPPKGSAAAVTTDAPQTGSWSFTELQQQLRRYEAELRAAGLADNSVHTYTQHPDRFLRWLVGRYEPGDRG